MRKTEFPKLIFTGVPGVGKTTLACFLAKEYGLKRADVFEYVSKMVKKVRRLILEDAELKMAYDLFLTKIEKKDFDIIEVANDWPQEILPRLVKIIKEKGAKKIALVLCHAQKKTILKRMRERGRKLPEFIIKRQSLYDRKFFVGFCQKIGIDFREINTEREIRYCQEQLVKTL